MLATSAIHNGILSLNRTNAYQLAQEGVELVRQMRDTTYIDGVVNDWNQNPAIVTGNSAIPAACATTGCALAQNGNTWTLLAGTPTNETISIVAGGATTNFTRVITVTPLNWYYAAVTDTGIPNVSAEQVTSTVSWQQDGRQIHVDSSTLLTDWRPVQ